MNQEIEKIVNQKNEIVASLIHRLKTTNDFYEGNQVALILIDHFRGKNIEDCLFELIKEPKWQRYNGTLLYALEEYTNNSKYLYFLVDLILKNEKLNDGEIFMGAYSMILNLQPPFDRKEITKSLQRVKKERKKKNLKESTKKLISSLINFLEGQRNIAKFYSRFGRVSIAE